MAWATFVWKEDPLKKMQYLKGSLQNKAIRIAMNAAAAAVKAAVIAEAPADKGNLKKSIRIKTKYYRGKKVWASIVGPSRSYKRAGPTRKVGGGTGRDEKGRFLKTTSIVKSVIRPARYAHLIQFGRKGRPANQFLTRALARSKSKYYSVLRSKLREQMDQILSKRV